MLSSNDLAQRYVGYMWAMPTLLSFLELEVGKQSTD
jgi:hypothetical protein